MKKIVCLLLVCCMAIGLYACGGESAESAPTADATASATMQATVTPTDAPTQSPEATQTPEASEAPATDAPVEKWLVADDAATWIESQSTEVKDGMVIETVTFSMEEKGTFIQLDQKLTKLIGKNGQDGEGYIKIVVGDGTAQEIADAYFLIQLVGSAYTGYPIDGNPNEDAITWYPRGNSAAYGKSTIYLNQGGSLSVPSITYGNHEAICQEGYMFAFTQKADGKVYIRSTSENASAAMQSYDTASVLASEYKLGDILGDDDETGEDGVYFRLQSHASEEQVFTVTIAYPA